MFFDASRSSEEEIFLHSEQNLKAESLEIFKAIESRRKRESRGNCKKIFLSETCVVLKVVSGAGF